MNYYVVYRQAGKNNIRHYAIYLSLYVTKSVCVCWITYCPVETLELLFIMDQIIFPPRLCSFSQITFYNTLSHDFTLLCILNNILKRMFNKYDIAVRTWYIWLSAGTSGGVLWTRYWIFVFHERQGISRPLMWLLVSQKNWVPPLS
jgi:hypothetical protein